MRRIEFLPAFMGALLLPFAAWGFDPAGVTKDDYLRLVMRHFAPVPENDICSPADSDNCLALYEAFRTQRDIRHLVPSVASSEPESEHLAEFRSRCPGIDPFSPVIPDVVAGLRSGRYALYQIPDEAGLGHLTVFYSERVRDGRSPRTGAATIAGNGLYAVYGRQTCERQTFEPVMVYSRFAVETPTHNHGFFMYGAKLHFFHLQVLWSSAFQHLGTKGLDVSVEIREFYRRADGRIRTRLIARYQHRPGA